MPKTKMIAVACVLAVTVSAGGAVVLALQESAASSTPISKQEGKITFNTQTGAVGARPDSYEVPADHQLELTLTLDVQGSGEAELANPPVRFPHGDPPQFHWKRVSPTEIVLTELNDNNKPGAKDEFYFKARVSSGGEVHESPDPTIVNLGPPAP